jgi:stage II sporulation protein D
MTGGGLVTLGSAQDSDPAQAGLSVSGTVSISADTVRIGLKYGDAALQAASLKNVVGSGFLFGYYDENRDFQTLGETDETSLTLIQDTNVSLSAGTVGCYPLLLPDVYGSFDDASAAAAAWSDAFVGCYSGRYRVLLGHYQCWDDANDAVAERGAGGEAFSASSKCVVVTKTGTTSILFEFDYGASHSIALLPVSASGKAVSSFGGYSYYGGFQFSRLDGDKMTVVNFVDIEDYIKGVVSAEMSEGWPVEALKAQAVAARTYVMRNLNGYSQYGFDVTGTASSQAYGGTSSVGSKIVTAVEATSGQYLTYRGTLCDTLYFSSDGGGTEDSENVFTNAIDYLRGVNDPYEEAAAAVNSYSSWTRSWNRSSISSKLVSMGYSFGTLSDIETTVSDTGNVICIELTDTSGKTVSFSGSKCYGFCYYSSRLNLPSIHFTVEVSETNPDVYVFKGGGWGHNVGMSQFGAYAMAKYYGKTYDQILAFYYSGVSLSRGVTA